MKYLMNLKKPTNRLFRGLLFIFLIKLITIIGILFIQSCQKESEGQEIYKDEQINNRYSEALNISIDNINRVPLIKIKESADDNYLLRTIQPNQVCLIDVDETTGNSVGTIQTLVESDNDYYLSDGDGNNYDIETEYCFTIPIEPTKQALAPAIEEAKNYLRYYGYNEADIQYVLDGYDESLLVPLVQNLIIVDNYYDTANDSNKLNIYSLLGTSAYASAEWPLAVRCAIEAIGFDVAYAFITGGIKAVGKKGLKKGIAKLASKFLGPVAVGIAVAEFGWCMYVNN